ncbi:hypothetical protein GCM10025868_46450 [Angustibacter aerolatus]|uniref:DUF1080 domain-containing protein n=1 Tax=Angustibacter aerolatus TaxID=1162965 RepID=A0ABQ6JRS9_9ACTN|nr:hypothetical protein GCM10025868_46450 [Angustibacter aerolatus]
MEYACDEITWTPGAAKARTFPPGRSLLDQRGADGWRLLNTDSLGQQGRWSHQPSLVGTPDALISSSHGRVRVALKGD